MDESKQSKATKAEIKDLGNKLSEETENSNTSDMSKQLAELNKIETKQLPVIKIREKDIELLRTELDITFDEAKLELIKYQGDVQKVIDAFLNNFNFD